MSYENDYISVYDYNNENDNENDTGYQSTGQINLNENIQLMKPPKKIYKKKTFNYYIIFFLIALVILLYFLIVKSCNNMSYHNPMNIEQIIHSEPIFHLRR
jgi:hypothetical protein